MSLPRICTACLTAIVLAGAFVGPGFAQTADPSAPALRGSGQTIPPLSKKPLPRKTKTALTKTGAAKTAAAKGPEKPELAPWAAVDPARAGEAEKQTPNAAPMPGIHHEAPSTEGNTTVGVKWNSNNSPNYGPMSTSGLMNGYNSTVNGAPDPGTSIQPGVKFKF